jgi:shikimate dehydrogenase
VLAPVDPGDDTGEEQPPTAPDNVTKDRPAKRVEFRMRADIDARDGGTPRDLRNWAPHGVALGRRGRNVVALPFVASPITLCGSLSRLASPLGRSMHEAGYRALGLPFTYVPFEVRDLAGALQGMRALGIRGFGVSHPFKQDVVPLLDALDPVAQRIGAVNTIVGSDGRLVGYNTDWIGAIRALEETRTLADASVLVLGAGGAARAIAFGLRERRARVAIANRTLAKAEGLARETSARAVTWDETTRLGDYDVVVNATCVGQEDAGPANLPSDSLRGGQLVMDIVYKPVNTRWLGAARLRGAVAVHGARMLIHQAAAQFELYTGRSAPLEPMEEALSAAMGAAN